MSILFAIIIFMLVILLHELGHFLMAKKVGIGVNEFSVGMGPAILQKKKDETVYSLRALPLGGYTAMVGEDEESTASNSFDQASAGARFLTILAGPLMNLLICIVCIAIVSGIVGVPMPVVGGFSSNSPAEKAGMEVGDRITAVDGVEINNFYEISEILQKSHGQPVEVRVQREAEEKNFEVHPEKLDGSYYLGFTAKSQRNFLLAIKDGFVKTFALLIQLFVVIFQLITGQLSMQALSGPIGVIHVIGEASKQGFAQLVFLTGYISLNLAFFNLLPIPALDGSRLLFIAIEKIRGKKMLKRTEERVTMIGFVFLMALILIVSVKDVITFF